jgi:MFS family permease
MMLFVPKIVERIGVKTLLLWGMAATVFRWVPFFFAGTWWHLIPIQMVQVFTIPFVYVGAVLFMDTEGPKSLRFTAQAFYSTIVLNTATIVGTMLGGLIAQVAGYPPLYLASGVFILAGTGVFALLIPSPKPGKRLLS